MLLINFSEAEIQQLNYERFYYPCPIVQKRIHRSLYESNCWLARHNDSSINGITPTFSGPLGKGLSITNKAYHIGSFLHGNNCLINELLNLLPQHISSFGNHIAVNSCCKSTCIPFLHNGFYRQIENAP